MGSYHSVRQVSHEGSITYRETDGLEVAAPDASNPAIAAAAHGNFRTSDAVRQPFIILIHGDINLIVVIIGNNTRRFTGLWCHPGLTAALGGSFRAARGRTRLRLRRRRTLVRRTRLRSPRRRDRDRKAAATALPFLAVPAHFLFEGLTFLVLGPKALRQLLIVKILKELIQVVIRGVVRHVNRTGSGRDRGRARIGRSRGKITQRRTGQRRIRQRNSGVLRRPGGRRKRIFKASQEFGNQLGVPRIEKIADPRITRLGIGREHRGNNRHGGPRGNLRRRRHNRRDGRNARRRFLTLILFLISPLLLLLGIDTVRVVVVTAARGFLGPTSGTQIGHGNGSGQR
jgi:hypothetical protein